MTDDDYRQRMTPPMWSWQVWEDGDCIATRYASAWSIACMGALWVLRGDIEPTGPFASLAELMAAPFRGTTVAGYFGLRNPGAL